MIERNYDNIPKELKKLKQWVCFKVEDDENNPGHKLKRLINPYNGKWAKVSEPRDWAYFSIAKKQMEKYGCVGLALCLTDIKGKDIRNDIFCIDLDKVLIFEEKTDFTDFDGSKIYDMFKSKTYIEYSISGLGLHILGIGNIEKNSRFRKGAVEMYDKARFMCLTGAVTPDSISSLGKLEKELRTANERFIGKPEMFDASKLNRGTISESDSELIEKIRNSKQGSKFSDLFDRGDINGDESASDFALCRILAFWTKNNEIQMDSIFRQSALMRPKWDKIHGGQTYGQLTIRNAIAKSSVTRNSR